ncbi:hypothetical protein M3182_21820 [Mesobacillus maritimus]|uniref:hypothetical protein n=1 Tax=Mesobacillus maritimus TaxID=1643336 RepID=UPI0020402FB3|nr:hypothetical protein [Mesobacillus maritimus]MCM3588320.1 hypothetical protein [Mesobacillus maritimus]
MKYSKTYIDNFFTNINDYHSMVELLVIAYTEFRERDTLPDWYVELREMMNWQAQSERSGVCTYYETLNDVSATIVIRNLETKEENEILTMFNMGINKYNDETIMEHIDQWILENEEKIEKYLMNLLVINKDWFYRI